MMTTLSSPPWEPCFSRRKQDVRPTSPHVAEHRSDTMVLRQVPMVLCLVRMGPGPGYDGPRCAGKPGRHEFVVPEGVLPLRNPTPRAVLLARGSWSETARGVGLRKGRPPSGTTNSCRPGFPAHLGPS